ncbi:MAG TPA: DUF4124 domain-containing protein [Rubrivivax sp.]|nr:DUF4124 domain-containing protein [Rubrivivax sp.]
MTKTTVLLPLFAAVLLLATSIDVPAQWAWRDANGRVNASDRPPPRGTPDKDIISRPAADPARRAAAPPVAGASAGAAAASAALPGAAAGTAAKGPLDRELEQRKRTAEQEQAAKAKADEERLATQRADNCRRARSQLAALDSGQRIARVNDKGEREILDDRGRADETRLAREVVTSDCR